MVLNCFICYDIIMSRTILFIIILIFVSLLGLSVLLYVYADPTKIHFYTRPIPITENTPPVYPKPQHQPPIIPPGVSTTTIQQPPVEPVDTRSWGERLRDPVIPDVPGAVWQIYQKLHLLHHRWFHRSLSFLLVIHLIRSVYDLH